MPTCLDCPATITGKAKSGRCKRCAVKHWNSTPEGKAIHKAACIKGAAARLAKPEEVAKLRAGMAAVNALGKTPEERARMAETRSSRFWCPPEWRDLNQKMRRNGVRTDERKRVIADSIAKAERDRVAALSPFARMLERAAKNGIVEKPVMRARESEFSLTGCAMGWL